MITGAHALNEAPALGSMPAHSELNSPDSIYVCMIMYVHIYIYICIYDPL